MPELQKFYEDMVKIKAEESIDQLHILNTKSKDGFVYDLSKEKKRYLAIINPRKAEEDKIEEELRGYRQLAAMTGQTLSKETEDEFRGK